MIRRCSLTLGLLSLSFFGAGAARAADAPITVESLLGRMTDLRWLAVAPDAGERTVQFSSYDRATKLGPDGKLVNPFANGDAGHYLRIDKRPDGSSEFVLAEAEGPGYVSRIWSANPAGTIRIYIDGSATPVLEAPFEALTHGKVAPFVPPFGQETSRGCSLYFPIPFAKSIKIVTDKGGQYFQVGVTTYAKGTPIESYSRAVLERAGSVMGTTREGLLHPPVLAEFEKGSGGLPVAPGATLDLFGVSDRHGALTAIRLKIDAADRDEALARSLLTITFDGAAQPQVAVPVGDFFGSGPGVNAYRSTPATVESDGTMTARWYMRFARSARIRLTNNSSKPLSVQGSFQATTIPGPEEPAPTSLLHFNARWLYEDGIQTKAGDGTKEWPALRVEGGAGRFVGLLLDVFNPTAAWWGEGDEKIYVDGETFPSTIGTGTEDYFGYAWCDPHTYTHPFHAETRCDGPGNKGYTSNVRYQILEAVPFHQSLAFDMEVWHWAAVKVQYASIAYFYAAPGTRSGQGVPDLTGRVMHPSGEGVRHEPGAIEAEKLRVLEFSGGEVPNQDMAGWGEAWSGGAQLWWTGTKVGQSLSLELPVAKGGPVALSAAFTKAPDYAVVTLTIDGKPLGDPIDLYARQVEHSGTVKLGVAELTPGPHMLKIAITGKNAKSSNTLVGMDWIKVEPAK
jgi:Protein of unknown function (DUF2961)